MGRRPRLATPLPDVHCGREATAGQRIEAKDDRGQCSPEVLEVRDDAAFCHYKGFHRKFDEWLPLESSRLRPFGSTKRDGRWKLIVETLWQGPVIQTISWKC